MTLVKKRHSRSVHVEKDIGEALCLDVANDVMKPVGA